jgi:phage tail sheath gpL-like
MIITSIPTTVRRPGAYVENKFVQAGQSLVPLPLRAVVVAEKTAAGTAAIETPIQVFDEGDADAKGGRGSPAAILLRTGFLQGTFSGATPEMWLCPIAEPVGGTAAQWTVTISVTTATGGTLIFTVAGRPVIVGVSAGDAQNTIATAIKNALDGMKSLIPFTAAVSTNTATLTHTTKGVNGNDATLALVQVPAGVTCTIAQSTTGAGAAVITAALQALYGQRYHGIAINNHTATDMATLVTEKANAWLPTQRNRRFFFVGERGSLGVAQTLQVAANDFGIVIGSYEGTPSLSGEIAVCDMIAEFSREAPNANLNNERVALYPTSGALAYSPPELEAALNGGLTPHEPDGSWSKITKIVTSAITLNGEPTEAVRSIAFPRTTAFRAEQIEIAFGSRFPQSNDTADTPNRVRDMIIEISREMERLGYLRDVDSFLDQTQVERSTSPAGRYVSNAPHRVAGPLDQLVVENTMFL